MFVEGHCFDAERDSINTFGKQKIGLNKITPYSFCCYRKPDKRPGSDELRRYKFVSKGTTTEVDRTDFNPFFSCSSNYIIGSYIIYSF